MASSGFYDFFYHGATALVGQGLLIIEGPWSPSLRHTTVGRTPLDEWSDRPRDLYLTTYNTQETDIRNPGGIRTHNPSKRATARPLGPARCSWLVGNNLEKMQKGAVAPYLRTLYSGICLVYRGKYEVQFWFVCNPVFKFLDGRREDKCSELSGSGHCLNLICSFFTVYIKLCYRSKMFELRHIFELCNSVLILPFCPVFYWRNMKMLLIFFWVSV
jgi:hypothetical protein